MKMYYRDVVACPECLSEDLKFDFIARVTQHIPEKGFHMVRYYGWYSNRSMGQLRKEGC